MKRIFLLFIVLLLPLSSGCFYLLFPSSMYRLSFGEEPFHSLVDKKLKLRRSLKVYGDLFASDLDQKESDSVSVCGVITKITFVDLDGKTTVTEYYKIPKELPKGTLIKFDSFRVERDHAFLIPYKIRYIASFQVVNNPDISPKLKFDYVWGRGLYLHKAPWESDTVPEKRYVGFRGKSYDPN